MNLLSGFKKILHPAKSDFPPDNTNLIVTSDTLHTMDMTGEFSPDLGEHSRKGDRTDMAGDIPKSYTGVSETPGSSHRRRANLPVITSIV